MEDSPAGIQLRRELRNRQTYRNKHQHPVGNVCPQVCFSLRNEPCFKSLTDSAVIRQISSYLFIYIFLIVSHFPQICFVPSDISALSFTDEWSDLVPMQNKHQLFRTRIHNKNVSAGEFQNLHEKIPVPQSSCYLHCGIHRCPKSSPVTSGAYSSTHGYLERTWQFVHLELWESGRDWWCAAGTLEHVHGQECFRFCIYGADFWWPG